MNKKVILASQSPARKQVLEQIGIPFDIQVSGFKEDMNLSLPPNELALYLSKGKAETVLRTHPDAIVIAADTFIVFNGALLGKPKDASDAKEMLLLLRGKKHVIITGLTVAGDNKTVSLVVSTDVYMKNSENSVIDDYVASGEPMGKAGSYAIQGKGSELVEKIEGDYFNVMGLPLVTLIKILKTDFNMQLDL